MNSDEIESPTSPSKPSSTGRRIRVRTLKQASISKEVNLPSVPSDDNDWVSPFTLPPLPTIKKPRTQIDRSPEDKHNRSGSSAYYAAAWGSPYATPSPSHTPAPKVRNKSFDLESSPLATRTLNFDRQHLRQNSLPTDELSRPRATPSPVDSEGKSQRRNWLSESEDSASEEEKDLGKTPTQHRLLSSDTPSSVRSHQVQESVDTITPETFNGASSLKVAAQTSPSKMADTQTASSPVEDKPLPNLPPAGPSETTDLQSRPAPLIPTQSFQRPKKKVPWKGKSCIIALPLTDRESADLPPVLSAEERAALLQRWADLGYPVQGFSVGDWYAFFDGASRSTFPDATDLEMDRQNNAPKVHVPDQAEWDAWVSYLKEEKLRALGVTPSTSEAPPSTMSPFSSTISRVSSAFPSNAAPSPPLPTRSATGHRAQMSVSPFAPNMMQTGGFPGFPQRGTPGLPNGRPMHAYAQSVAFPGMGRMGSPFAGMDGNQFGGYSPNVRSPDGMMNGRKPWSPGHMQNMQSMAHMISPVQQSPHDFTRQFSPHAQHAQIQAIQAQQEAITRQQQQVQARMAHARQMSMFPFRTASTEQIRQLPETPKALSPDREPPEIMQPTPRSHRHNLSAALEKGVTDTVAASAKQLSNVLEAEKENFPGGPLNVDEVEEGEIAEQTEQEELPILHRPETLKDGTDEKAEIETNPSIAGTPLLLEEKNPFANFAPLPVPEKTEQKPNSGHIVKPSMSKFNVQAKEFSPFKSAMSPTVGVFNFNGNALDSQISSPTKSVADASRIGHKHNPSSLGLNVAAPVFTPVFGTASNLPGAGTETTVDSQKPADTTTLATNNKNDSISEKPVPTQAFDPNASAFSFGAADEIQQGTPAKSVFDPRSSTFSFIGQDKSQFNTPLKSDFDPNASTFSPFSFGSTSLNVEAPEFKPTGMFGARNFTPEKPAMYSGTMFGDVVIDPSNKPERRTKAVAIVKPESREGSAAPMKDEEDAAGRLVAPSERHKRAKTNGLDNEEILFATSAPFASLSDEKPLESLNEENEETAEAVEDVESAQIEHEPKADAERPEAHDEPQPEKELIDLEEVDQAKHQPELVEESRDLNPATATFNEPGLVSVDVNGPDVKAHSASSSADLVKDGTVEDGEPGPAVEEDSEQYSAAEQEESQKPSQSPSKTETSVKDISKALSGAAPTFEPKTSVLSATAFEFTPRTSETASKPAKKGGLMASRFASSPPVESSPQMVQRNSSPPQQLFGEVSKESYTDSPSRDREQVRHEYRHSEEAARTLERFREDSVSGASDHGDMSLDEINAVMKQFEEDPDLGIIREDTPVKFTPLIDIRFPQRQFRSDAPSPSPNRQLDRPFNPQHREQRLGGLGFDVERVHQLNYGGSGDVSDWNAELSPGQQDKLESRAQFFDDHVNDIVDNVLENRLAPLERALENIQSSMQQASNRSRPRRSASNGNKHSDADDEEDPVSPEGFHQYQSRSPGRSQRQQERIKAAVMEAMTVAQSTLPSTQIDTSAIQEMLVELKSLSQEQKQSQPQNTELLQLVADLKSLAAERAAEPKLDVEATRTMLDEIRTLAADKPPVPSINFSTILASLAELRAASEHQSQAQTSGLKSIVEEAITKASLAQPRSTQEIEDKLRLERRVSELEAMLKAADHRADQEAALRREGEELNEELSLKLQKAVDQSSSQDNRGELNGLRLKSAELEKTLDEYRHFKHQLTHELEKERSKSEKMASALSDARQQHNDQLETRNALRDQMAKVQERIVATTESFHQEQADWRQREHEVLSKNELLKQSLDFEISKRSQLQFAIDAAKNAKDEGLLHRAKHEAAQEEVARLANIIVGLQKEVSTHHETALTATRGLDELKSTYSDQKVIADQRLQAELEDLKARYATLQSDSDARVARLTADLEASNQERAETKAKHDSNLQKMFENHNRSVQAAEARHSSELEQRLAFHEERLLDLKQKHERDIANAAEDRASIEHRYSEKLSLSDDKVKHLESRIEDLKHSLDITQKAARAAAESAISKGVNLPTPASSVVASPPHRASISSASMPLQRGTDLPEKISPQALRESILVLQEQLQNREAKIDKLEAELAAIDKEAPTKVKERDTEIVMLRELLDVRIDDLQEVIAQLERPDYNRQAVKDAAIRLKTQIKMDQQLRERAITEANQVPSLTAGISNITQTPRSMVAAAAWSNWRKIRDSSIGNAAVDLASNIASTPTRSNSASHLSRTRTPENSRPSTARPLANVASSRKGAPPTGGARPLRTISTQPRTLSSARPLARRGTNESRPGSSTSTVIVSRHEQPSTPTQGNMDSDFGDDIDEDASPLDGKDRGFDSELEEPKQTVSRRTSRSSMSKPPSSPRATCTSMSKTPSTHQTKRTSRHSSGKPVSPRALRQSAGMSQNEVVEVFEED